MIGWKFQHEIGQTGFHLGRLKYANTLVCSLDVFGFFHSRIVSEKVKARQKEGKKLIFMILKRLKSLGKFKKSDLSLESWCKCDRKLSRYISLASGPVEQF